MSKTLADMTPEERLSCVGMWCNNSHPSAERTTAVVLGGIVKGLKEDLCLVSHTDLRDAWSLFSLKDISPLFNTYRAWEAIDG